MGNHLVAKLAFFPPDPAKYGKDGLFYSQYKNVTAFVTTSERHYEASKAGFEDSIYGCTVPLMHIKHKNPRFTLLFSHGNAEDIGVNKLFCEWLSAQLAVDIVTYDYTGYGLSSGDQPCEKHLYADSMAVYSWMIEVLKLTPDRIILYGKSLGTAPTIDLGTRVQSMGIILVCPLASGARVVFPKMKNFITDGVFCPSISKIGKVKAPVFIMHGTNDEVIDVCNGHDLYEECQANHPLPPVWVDGAGHNDIESRYHLVFLKGLRMFLDHCAEIRQLRPPA